MTLAIQKTAQSDMESYKATNCVRDVYTSGCVRYSSFAKLRAIFSLIFSKSASFSTIQSRNLSKITQWHTNDRNHFHC